MSGQPQPVNPEMDESPPVVYFDPSSGRLLQADELPAKTAHIFVILKRGALVFNALPLKSQKTVKLQDIFAVQKNFIPFQAPYCNLIYRLGQKPDFSIAFWLGKIQVDHRSLFYDELPETLLFRGNPEQLAQYRLFVFNRGNGFEVIYFDGQRLFSSFAGSEEQLEPVLLQLIRYHSLQGQLKVISDHPLPVLPDVAVDLLPDSAPYYLLSNHTRLTRVYSNISQDKKMRSIRRLNRSAGRYLNVIIGAVMLLLLLQLFFHFSLRRAGADLERRWQQVQQVLSANEELALEVRRMDQRLAPYPDHLGLFQSIVKAIDPDSYISSYTLRENQIEIQGFSKSSMDILRDLKRIPGVDAARFKTPVQKNIQSKTERFSIEITLQTHGQ